MLRHFLTVLLFIFLGTACMRSNSEQPANSDKTTISTIHNADDLNKHQNTVKKKTEPVPAKEAVPAPQKKEENPEPVTNTKPSKTTPATKQDVKEVKVVSPPPPKEVRNTTPSEKPPPEPVIEKKKEQTPQPKEVKKETPVKVPEKKAAPPFNHDLWDQLLRKYVNTTAGSVNYKGIQAEKAVLEEYLALLAANPVQSSWSRNKKMAYWINAYNAYTVKLIIDNYPVTSITKLHNGKPWDVPWITLGNKTYSLNNIENDILRPQYKDARIHFAVNCAAKSCPPLLNRAWTAQNLHTNLEQQTKNFINNPKYTVISEKKADISKIFEWYAADFGNIIKYLNMYSDAKLKDNAKVQYMEYDWRLNEK